MKAGQEGPGMSTIDRDRFSPPATQVLRVPAPGADDVMLGILAIGAEAPDRSFPPVLLVHGATFGASLFDLQLPGYSLLAELARAGRAVYALDVRGYGHSLGGRVMDAPPEAHPPFARLNDAIADIGAAVRFILRRENATALDLVGFSWGTVTSACYAGRFPHHVSRLALYAPLYAERNEIWLARIGDPRDRSRIDPAIGAYRLITEADIVTRWDADVGGGDPRQWREDGLPAAIFDVFRALDRQSWDRVPPAFRAPTGALADLIHVFDGKPLYDPAQLSMPVLLVRGADDTTSTGTDSERLLSLIASPWKSYRVISPGSHFLCVEKNRAELYRCLDEFLLPLDQRPEQATA
jgi:pimeloyl-ACP methyl ester carboxylesterase